MKNKELDKYQNKQLNSETPYGLKPYQVLITAIIVLLVGLFIVIPMVISKEYGFNFDYATTVLAVFIFIIFLKEKIKNTADAIKNLLAKISIL